MLRNTFGNLETVTIDMGSDRIHLNEVRLLQLALAGTPTKVNAKIYSPEDLDILLAMKRKNTNLSFQELVVVGYSHRSKSFSEKATISSRDLLKLAPRLLHLSEVLPDDPKELNGVVESLTLNQIDHAL